MGARLLVYDKTCLGSGDVAGAVRGAATGAGSPALPLSRAWAAGAGLYRALGRIDEARGVASWAEALAFLASAREGEAIDEIQYWGHGKWGTLLVGDEPFDARALEPMHVHARALDAVRERLSPGALFWARTCETFGAEAGRTFAARLADRLGARVAGHTYVIGLFQSGLFGLAPGQAPYWSAAHGLADGTPEVPRRAHVSSPTAPRTVTCFSGRVPAAWFASDAPAASEARGGRP